MKLTNEEADILRKYVAIVDSVVTKYVPATVPGIHEYNLMMTYKMLRGKVGDLFSNTNWEKTSKWRQIDLEEAINNEKKKS